jgi:hypothetical protein
VIRRYPALKRLKESEGDITRFRVVRIQPSVLKQLAIAKTEPGDENNQDISSLVVDIRKLEVFSQDDPDAYSYSGGLCQANQGLLEFVEMFKAPIKMLHPLLTATQEGNFKGTEGFSAIPFNGIILAHSNLAMLTHVTHSADSALRQWHARKNDSAGTVSDYPSPQAVEDFTTAFPEWSRACTLHWSIAQRMLDRIKPLPVSLRRRLLNLR